MRSAACSSDQSEEGKRSRAESDDDMHARAPGHHGHGHAWDEVTISI